MFPGRADGSVTERIANAVSRLSLPMADALCDLYSSPTWHFPSSSTTHPFAAADLMGKTVRMAEAFKFPMISVWECDDTPGTWRRHGQFRSSRDLRSWNTQRAHRARTCAEEAEYRPSVN
ncbi:hypothetical protein NKH95_29535 [Mesorhizobium sp. M0848]